MQKSSPSGKPLKILVACGTAIATSTHVALKIKELLNERELDPIISQCRVSEIPSMVSGSQVVVATAQVAYKIDVPVVDGLPFLTGIGVKEVIDKLETILNEVP